MLVISNVVEVSRLGGNDDVDQDCGRYSVYALGESSHYYVTAKGTWQISGYEAFCPPAHFTQEDAVAAAKRAAPIIGLPVEVRCLEKGPWFRIPVEA